MKIHSNATLRALSHLLITIVVLFITSEIHMLVPAGNPRRIASLIVPVFYMLCIVTWTISIVVRVNQRQTRMYLIFISVVEIFWLVIRYIKENFSIDIVSARHLWYMYYIGIIIVPLLIFFVALSIGHDEHYHIPFVAKLLYVPAIILISEISSNDYHQMAFKFTKGIKNYDTYSFGVVYYIAVVWVAIFVLISWWLFISKCRIHRGRIDSRIVYVPILFVAVIAIYDTLSHSLIPSYSKVALDLTSLYCVSVVLVLEIIIQCGIIPSNHSYHKVFNLSTIGVLVTDKKNNIVAQSNGFEYDVNEVKKLAPGHIVIHGKKRLSKVRTRSGFLVWEDDISKLMDSIEELMDLNDQLAENIDMLQEEYDSARRHQKLVERNRIYDLMQTQTTGRIRRVSTLVDELEQATDPIEEKNILSSLVLLTTYIKRRNNLIFLAEDNNMLPISELTYCLRETTNNMKLYGINSGYHVSIEGQLPFYTIMNIYDMIQDVIELAFDGLNYFYINLKKEELVILTIRLDTTVKLLEKSDLKKYAGSDITLEEEDDDNYIVIFKTAEE